MVFLPVIISLMGSNSGNKSTYFPLVMLTKILILFKAHKVSDADAKKACLFAVFFFFIAKIVGQVDSIRI
jgi:hypothetical protein